MIQIRVSKSREGLITDMLIVGHSDDLRVCASVSMAIEISRKLLGGTGPRERGGFYYVGISPDRESQTQAKGIVGALELLTEGVTEHVGDFLEFKWQPFP